VSTERELGEARVCRPLFPKGGMGSRTGGIRTHVGSVGNRAHPASLDCGVRSDASPLLRPQRKPRLSFGANLLFFHATSRRGLRISGRAAACGAMASFVAFDLLQVEREDWRKLALEVSRAQLESLVAGIDAITFSEAIDDEGAIVFAKACEMGLEGIVSKRLGGVYSSGPCRNWVKVRNPEFSRT
jgi:ATP dependent DNA ligase domain